MTGAELEKFNAWIKECFLLLDECDHQLIDGATTLLQHARKNANYLALDKLMFEMHASMAPADDGPSASAKLAELASDKLHKLESGPKPNLPHMLPLKNLICNLWQGADRALRCQARRDFVVKAKKQSRDFPRRQDPTIVPVDLATGIEQPLLRWTYEGPFVEMQQGLPMTGIEPAPFFSSLVAFVQAYGWFGGFSGTLGPSSARRFLRDVYQADAIEIPRHMPSRFYDLSPIVYGKQPNAKKKWLDKIAQQTGDFFNGALMARFGPLARNTCLQQMLPFALLPTPRGSKASRLAAPARFSSLWRACRRLMKCTTR